MGVNKFNDVSLFPSECFKNSKLLHKFKGEKPGLVVKADGSRSRGRGFEPRHCILDGCKRCQLLHTRK
jgi:hypothetical protein